jgi:hypothetical protein
MLGLGTSIHGRRVRADIVFSRYRAFVDGRIKSGHDDVLDDAGGVSP